MTKTASTRAVLTFGDGYGNKASFSIPRARDTKTGTEARETMNMMIESGALFLENLPRPVSQAMGAKLVTTTRTQIV